jgi:putative polyhydroxyalkanoic acid system protein
MPSLKITVPHQLGQEEAVMRLKGFLAKVKERYQNQLSDLQETWTDNKLDFAFKTYGFTIKGSMVVEPADVLFEGQIPFAAMMFKGKIEQTLRDEITRVLTSPQRGPST